MKKIKYKVYKKNGWVCKHGIYISYKSYKDGDDCKNYHPFIKLDKPIDEEVIYKILRKNLPYEHGNKLISIAHKIYLQVIKTKLTSIFKAFAKS